jgi:colanic acid/amylovoran biosynthesis glycosyltransferase
MKAMKKKICFVLSGYPVISHTFLYNQIIAVIESDKYDVQIVTLKFTGETVHKAYERLNERIVLCPMSIGQKLAVRLKLAASAIATLVVNKPVSILRSFNFVKYSRNASNLNYLILAKSFIKLNADIFHCHFGNTAKIVADLKEIGAVKGIILSSFHGADITVFPKKYGREFYEGLFNTGDVFTGNSRFIISKMIENGCPENKIVKIPECLNVSQFEYRGEDHKRKKFKILTVGRFVEKKGYEYSMRAVANFRQQKIDFEYNVIGEGPLLDSMKELARQLGITDSVIFRGAMKQEEVMAFYRQSDIFLLPSVTAADGDTEGQGLVLQEAQAIGLPVVATLHNGFPDSIVDGKTGYLVPEKDSDALFEKLLFLYNDEKLCVEMGVRGRAFVESSFDSKVVVAQLINLYENTLINE